ncbi:MAG: hypothetical protein V3T40_04160 [Nitrososphaerales archaeon]
MFSLDRNEIEILNTILSMMAKDPKFRNKIFTEPAKVLAKYQISDKARSIIIETIRGILSK